MTYLRINELSLIGMQACVRAETMVCLLWAYRLADWDIISSPERRVWIGCIDWGLTCTHCVQVRIVLVRY